MKKILFLTIVTVFSCSLLFGQDETTDNYSSAKNFIGITVGYANATGNFVKNNYDDNQSGYANSAGFNIGLGGAYYFHKHIGIGGVFSNTSFYTKGLQTMVDGYKEAFDLDSSTVIVSGKYIITLLVKN